MNYSGYFRVYWNRRGDYPLVWSIDFGDVSTEMNVKQIYLRGKTITTCVRMNADNVLEPRGWLEGNGVVVIADEIAEIFVGEKG